MSKDRDGVFGGDDEFGGFDVDGEKDETVDQKETAAVDPEEVEAEEHEKDEDEEELDADEEDADEDEEDEDDGDEEDGDDEEPEGEEAKGKESPSLMTTESPAAPKITESPAAGVPEKVKRHYRKRQPSGNVPQATLVQKMVRLMLSKAKLEELPPLSELMGDKHGTKLVIKDISLFIGKPDDPLLAELAETCNLRNRTNLSAEVQRKRAVSIGVQILRAGRMYQPIHVACVEEKGGSFYECTSGRHRLAFLAMAYGPDAKIPVYVEKMTLVEARQATLVANQVRPVKAMERAEHTVMDAVKGNVHAKQDEMYDKTAVSKRGAKQYCIFSVVNRKYPVALEFPVSAMSSRKSGALTTVANVGNFWGAALEWNKETDREAYDTALKDSVVFLNAMVSTMQAEKDFNSSQHMASMTMAAIGRFWRTTRELKGPKAKIDAKKVAKVIVGMGGIGRQKLDATFKKLAAAMQ